MTIKQIRNIAFITIAGFYMASCDQIVTTSPKTIDGEWNCEENHFETGKSNYYINIEYTDSTKKAIKIFNFNNLGASFYAKGTIAGSNISIPKQSVDKDIIEGKGTIAPDYKTLTFDYNDDYFGNGGGTVTTKCIRLKE